MDQSMDVYEVFGSSLSGDMILVIFFCFHIWFKVVHVRVCFANMSKALWAPDHSTGAKRPSHTNQVKNKNSFGVVG